jgi:biopolymer transport protein ExbB
MKKLFLFLFVTSQAFAATNPSEQSQQSVSMQELLNQIAIGTKADQVSNQERLNRFESEKENQAKLLDDMRKARIAAEILAQQKEQQFEKNERDITALQTRLTERLGSLKELFGVLQLVATDSQGQFASSLTQIHYPDRTQYLTQFADKMGQTTQLPSIQDIEQLWFEIQRDMVESGSQAISQQTILTKDGQQQTTDVIRVGTFNLVANQSYLQRISETGQLVEFGKQPSSRYMSGAEKIAQSQGNLIPFTIDPIRGQLLAIKGAAPDLKDRVGQGGEIGFIIIALGVVVIAIAIIRFAYLSRVEHQVNQQLNQLDQPKDNPLGRIITVYQNNRAIALETLELKLGEAILREIPKINWGLSFLKISAAIAPLMGLLGTVTGMIITFQAITLFGAGDPKLMAGGISQALVTTVLGLTVAIPTLLLHNLVQGKATKLTEILEQEAVALVALNAESEQEAS